MAELESKIQARIIKRLEAQGYYVVKLILTNKKRDSRFIGTEGW